MPFIDRITVYPIKSLEGVVVERATVLPGAGLEHDRRWQLVDMEGRVVNAKRTPLLHAIRTQFHIEGLVPVDGHKVLSDAPNAVELTVDPDAVAAGHIRGIDRLATLEPATFPLVPGSEGPCEWLSIAFGQDVLLIERRNGGFPDDRDASGPTLASSATLAEVARWFGFSLEECRRRFRVNLEIGGCDPFWEDTLASPMRVACSEQAVQSLADVPADPYAALPPPEPRKIQLGDVRLQATNVCRRCVVPTRDSRTGAVTGHFRDAFEARRARSIRPDVDASSWNHWYRLAVNTFTMSPGPIVCGVPVLA